MIKPVSSYIQTRELFCHKYWQQVLKNTTTISSPAGRFDFRDANEELMGLNNFHLPHTYLNELIKNNDLTLKLLSKPIPQKLVLWRGIPNPLNSDDNSLKYLQNLFQKCINLKKNEVIHMPEYSFWTDRKQTALRYANDQILKSPNGILYELTVPKNSNLYTKIYTILQRYSKFLCTDNTQIIEDGKTYNHIKLTLLPKDIELE